MSREVDSTTITVPGGHATRFEILAVNAFTASRKRMSTLLRLPGGDYKLYCKGADSSMFPRLVGAQPEWLVKVRHCVVLAIDSVWCT